VRIVIGGAGEVGRHLAGLLSHRGDDVVLIDEQPAVLEQAEQGLDVQGMAGDLASRRVLGRAKVDRADAFIAVTGSDDANLLAAAFAREMGADVAVARVDQPSLYLGDRGAEHGVLGIDHVLCSTRLAAAELLTHTERVEGCFVHGYASGSIQVALWEIEPDDAAVGAMPDALRLPRGVRIGGVVRDAFVRPAAGAARLEPRDKLVLGGPAEAVSVALGALQGRSRSLRHVVVGGSEIGVILAGTLAARGHRVELVESDRSRAEALAAQLAKVRVLRGDPTDLGFLRDIRFHEADSVLAVTRKEEVNLITTLLVRQHEAGHRTPHTFVSVHRHGYSELCRRLGIEGAVGTFEVLSRAVLEAIAPAGVVCSNPLPGLAWVVADLRLPAHLSGALAVDGLVLPPGVALLAIGRGEQVLDATGTTALAGGDELVLLSPARDLPAVERAVRALGKARP
jgi:trk system potassium uptake protein TrkA